MKYLTLIFVLFIAACTTVPTQVIVPEKDKVVISPELIQPCDTHLKKLDQKQYTESETVKGPVQTWANQYDDCAANHNALIKVVIDAFNIQKTEPKSSK